MATFITDGALDTNRTCDPPLRRGMLYPLSYEGVCAVSVLSGKILREIASGNERPKQRLTFAAAHTAGR